MGREVRQVPANWGHPKGIDGYYIPLYGESLSKAQTRWDLGNAKWAEGLRKDSEGGWIPLGDTGCQTYSEYAGKRPIFSDYVPDWPDSERTHYQMYETCSEGTPISPVMETPEALARWLADNEASAFGRQTASYKAWLRVCQGGYACSAVRVGNQLLSGVEGLAQLDGE